ncbi:MAG: sulfite exporter TauE/SafE family protein [Candidatus Staskawiczbacteria bacterium]|nr:sulfite exporter TauE/SafE family protein [Candidatus Staskawiczbacteria bacterium]
MKEYIYKVQGMHCASCEILIEKKLLEVKNIKSVNASTPKGEVVIKYNGDRPSLQELGVIFKNDKYSFFENSDAFKNKPLKETFSSTYLGFTISILIVLGFLLLDKMGISGLLSISSKSSVFSFFGFGILAGLSSCAALVGGIVLSMSKQWQELYANERKTYKKFQPHLLFNAGRIISYALFGALLGAIGSRLAISLTFTSFLLFAVSILMILLGLQMLGVKGFNKFQISTPKFITRGIANENNFKGKYMPLIMGALTFFLPCGFTITAQTIALLSASPLQGGLIMGFFALGTAPMLLLIGFSSVKFFEKPHLSATFSKIAGFLVIFFAFYNIYNQLNVLGLIK